MLKRKFIRTSPPSPNKHPALVRTSQIPLIECIASPNIWIGPCHGLLEFLTDTQVVYLMRTCTFLYKTQYKHVVLQHKEYIGSDLFDQKRDGTMIPSISRLYWSSPGFSVDPEQWPHLSSLQIGAHNWWTHVWIVKNMGLKRMNLHIAHSSDQEEDRRRNSGCRDRCG